MVRRKRFVPVLTSVVFLLPLWSPGSVQAWEPYTHILTANQIRDEVVSNRDVASQEGLVTVSGRQYRVRKEIADALDNWPQFYNAGVIGPDGFPDLAYGQGVIHGKMTGEWLRHIHGKAWATQADPSYTEDERSQILAWTYGFLTHAAGDMWAHTLVNDFTEGVFPEVQKILTNDPGFHLLENALRHIIVEGYIKDATRGFDGDGIPNAEDELIRGPVPTCHGVNGDISGDVSDDSTPCIPLDAPHRFIYNTLIGNRNLPDDPAADTPLGERGVIIDYFLDLAAVLATSITTQPGDPRRALQDAAKAYDKLKSDLDGVKSSCDFDHPQNINVVDCLAALAKVGVAALFATAEAFETFAADEKKQLAKPVLDAYLAAWIQDINDGLIDWSRFGLATTQALFDPQTRRDVQNAECAALGTETSAARIQCEDKVEGIPLSDQVKPFFTGEQRPDILSMLGLPDVTGGVLGAIQDAVDTLGDFISQIVPLPLKELRAKVGEAVDGLVDSLIETRFGIDVQNAHRFLKAPDAFLDYQTVQVTLPQLRQTTINFLSVLIGPINVPQLSTVTINLFSSGDPLPGDPHPRDHPRLDGFIGLSGNHHVVTDFPSPGDTRLTDAAELTPAIFAAYANTITMARLLLLDGPELNRLLSDLLGRTIATYNAGDNVMFTGRDPQQSWLRLIDGDHAWRRDGLPRFCSDTDPACPNGYDPKDIPLPPASRSRDLNGGTGEFPIWKSCVLRPAFRVLFRDWENGTAMVPFPDLLDGVGADQANDLDPPVSQVTRAGEFFINGPRQFVAADNNFTLSAHDTPGMGFKDSALGLQFRIYTDALNPGPFVTAGQGQTFSIAPPDGRHLVDFRSGDPCHTFADDPLPPEPTQTFEVFLDTTPPVITINSPMANAVFASDAISNIQFTTHDGTLGSGVASSAVTLDGAAATNGQVLEMFLLAPGPHAIVVTAVDNLNNRGAQTQTFTLHATTQSLINTLNGANAQGLISDPGVFKGLLDKLVAANKQHDRGGLTSELNILQAFVNQLLAQRGKGIDAATADRLIAFARDLIARGG